MNVVSRRYARALIEGLPADRSAAGLDQLRQLSDIVAREPGARKLLMNPSVPQDRRDALIASLAAALSLDPPVRNLLAMLVDRRRLDILGEVRDAYQDAFDVRSGTVRVRVASAAPLGEGERQQITDRLETATGKRVLMEVDLDPSLIGGIVVRLGGTVMDASLRQQLAGFGRHLRAH